MLRIPRRNIVTPDLYTKLRRTPVNYLTAVKYFLAQFCIFVFFFLAVNVKLDDRYVEI